MAKLNPFQEPITYEKWKLQRPIFTTGSKDEVYIYNQDRSAEGMIPLTNKLAQLFGSKWKIFAWGWIDQEGLIHIDSTDIVPEEEWPSW